MPLLPDYWDVAKTQLMKNDRILRRIIPLHCDEPLLPKAAPFVTLVRCILAQQAGRQTAQKQWQNLTRYIGCDVRPELIGAESLENLRQIGLPRRKAEYIIGVSQYFNQGRFDITAFSNWENEQIIQRLTEIRGVGRWTAEMFLIFNLRRADVLPLDDAGLLKAISTHYFSGEPVSRFEAREVAQAWSPWCTVATWYLWRSLDAVAVHY